MAEAVHGRDKTALAVSPVQHQQRQGFQQILDKVPAQGQNLVLSDNREQAKKHVSRWFTKYWIQATLPKDL
jgi:hypothetical protein